MMQRPSGRRCAGTFKGVTAPAMDCQSHAGSAEFYLLKRPAGE